MFLFWYIFTTIIGYLWECAVLAFRERFDVRSLFLYCPNMPCSSQHFQDAHTLHARSFIIIFICTLSAVLGIASVHPNGLVRRSMDDYQSNLFYLWFCMFTIIMGSVLAFVYITR
eukprot:UN04452